MPGAGVIWKRLTYRCDPKSGLSWDCQPKTLTVCWGAWTSCNVVGSEKEHAGTDCLENEIPRWEAAGRLSPSLGGHLPSLLLHCVV